MKQKTVTCYDPLGCTYAHKAEVELFRSVVFLYTSIATLSLQKHTQFRRAVGTWYSLSESKRRVYRNWTVHYVQVLTLLCDFIIIVPLSYINFNNYLYRWNHPLDLKTALWQFARFKRLFLFWHACMYPSLLYCSLLGTHFKVNVEQSMIIFQKWVNQ